MNVDKSKDPNNMVDNENLAKQLMEKSNKATELIKETFIPTLKQENENGIKSITAQEGLEKKIKNITAIQEKATKTAALSSEVKSTSNTNLGKGRDQ